LVVVGLVADPPDGARAGLLFSVLITAVLTDAIKDGIGRPRPNFFWRCFPDGLPVSSPVSSLKVLNFRVLYSVAA